FLFWQIRVLLEFGPGGFGNLTRLLGRPQGRLLVVYNFVSSLVDQVYAGKAANRLSPDTAGSGQQKRRLHLFSKIQVDRLTTEENRAHSKSFLNDLRHLTPEPLQLLR